MDGGVLHYLSMVYDTNREVLSVGMLFAADNEEATVIAERMAQKFSRWDRFEIWRHGEKIAVGQNPRDGDGELTLRSYHHVDV